MPHQFGALLDHPLRLRYRAPGATLALYDIVPGMTLLDLGCGTGTFTVEMARMVGEAGTVHALDLQRGLLDRAEARVRAAQPDAPVEFHHAGAERLPLPDSSCDLIVMIATLAQVPDRYGALLEARRVLKPYGRLAVSEELPDPAYVPARVVRYWLADAGFTVTDRGGNPFCYHLIAEPPK